MEIKKPLLYITISAALLAGGYLLHHQLCEKPLKSAVALELITQENYAVLPSGASLEQKSIATKQDYFSSSPSKPPGVGQ